jgi:nucleoside-diphosphate-sugar epimerase
VGRFLLPRLAGAGWDVEAVSRRAAPPAPPAGVRWSVRDVAQGWNGQHVDVLFHAAPLWLLPPLLPGLAKAGGRRLVAFGSTSRFSKEHAASAASRAVARRLAEAEEALGPACAAHGIAWTLFRPTLIYGTGRDRNVSAMARFIRRFGFFPLAGAAPGLRQPVHADDLAAACLQAVDAPATFFRSYDLPGGSTLPYREMAAQIFAACGRRERFVRLPLALLRGGLALASHLPRLGHLSPDMADRMQRDQAFDAEGARRDFGYAPRPFDAASVVSDLDAS